MFRLKAEILWATLPRFDEKGVFSMAILGDVKTVKNFIGGTWLEPTGDETRTIPDPTTGEPLVTLTLSTKNDVAMAVAAA